MKCANCGNENPKTLWDEGDTFYCSVCCHRTQTVTGQDDLITCPFCGRLRDRKAYECMWCGNSLDSQPGPSREEFEELDDEFLLVRTLTEARKEAGMTQQQLAEKSGVHQVNISRIENGTGNPSVETLQKLAKGMGKKLIIAFA